MDKENGVKEVENKLKKSSSTRKGKEKKLVFQK